MTLLTSIVDLECIQVHQDRCPFDWNNRAPEIEALARSIRSVEGLVRLPVVKSLGIDEYELVEGYLEYYAYLKARELNPDLPDRIMVFVMKPNNADAILQQLEVNRQIAKVEHPSGTTTGDGTVSLKLSNLESKVDEGFERFSLEFQNFKDDLMSTMSSKISEFLPSSKINQIKSVSSHDTNSITHQSMSLLDAFNRLEEDSVRDKVVKNISQLKGDTQAKKIVDSLQKYRKNGYIFKTYNDVLNSLKKGTLKREKMIDLIDNWQLSRLD